MTPGLSGSRVALVETPTARYVVKTGLATKVRVEAEQCRVWARAFPGLGREVVAEVTVGSEHAFVGEFLAGVPLARLLADRDPLVGRALAVLTATLGELWGRSREARPVPAAYAADVATRLRELHRQKPWLEELMDARGASGASGRELLAELAAREPALAPPFSVMTHGDLTPDNVLYDDATGRVRFLDLARSGPGDYVLDVGKFVAARRRIRRASADDGDPGELAVTEAAAAFARASGDGTFAVRLQVSIARTLLGSARLMDDVQARWQMREGFDLLARALAAAAAP